MKKLIMIAAAAPLLALGACADNYAVEGAAAGAAGGALLGGEEGAAIGAAAGGVVGSQIKKDGDCDGYDRRGRLDPDCYGRDGYPRR